MRRWLLRGTLVVVCAAPWGVAAAQDSTTASGGAYSMLTLGVSGGRAVADRPVDRYWSSSTAVRVDVHTRFHVGDIGLYVVTLPYAAYSAEQPDFRAWILAADWRFAPAAPMPIKPMISVSAGNYLTTFDGVETKGLAKESEIFVGGSVGVAARIYGGTHATATWTGLQVLTSTPIRSAFVTFGLAHTVATPRWMRTVFE